MYHENAIRPAYLIALDFGSQKACDKALPKFLDYYGRLASCFISVCTQEVFHFWSVNRDLNHVVGVQPPSGQAGSVLTNFLLLLLTCVSSPNSCII